MASQEQIIAGLLVNGTVTATAEQLGMSRAGIYKAMQAESFNEARGISRGIQQGKTALITRSM